MIKATYSLDPDTVRTLEAMARRLGVSKSAALREAIHVADRAGRAGRSERTGDADPRLAALDRLQKQLALSPQAADTWVLEARQLRQDNDRIARIWGTTAPVRRVAETPRRGRK
ncbi:MAG: ribbon-helix-helix protein, CopG family [Gemmatimonadota bacterium]|nr:ribbon-helix-helix protein, CopG family [Gemmatimonadota bacterium]